MKSKIHIAYIKALKVLRSCKTYEQLMTACRYVELFGNHFYNDDDMAHYARELFYEENNMWLKLQNQLK
jgi:hypothetical protein